MMTIERDEERERERFGEHLVPLSLYQTRVVFVLMSSWYRGGHGWSMRIGSWGMCSEIGWFCLRCRKEFWRFGVKLNWKVLSWSESGKQQK